MALPSIPKCICVFLLLITWRPADVDGTRISTNLLDQRLSKDQAVQACTGSNITSRSRLLTYEGATEQSAVARTMTDKKIQQTWLAVHKESFPIWMWLDNQPVGKDLASQKWPDHMNCGVLHLRDATLEMDDCSIHLGFLCQISSGTCADRGISHVECVDMKSHSYVYQCSVSNWYAARQKCKDDGLELAVIRSEEAMANLTRVWYRNNRRPCVKLWVGLRHHEWIYTGRPGSTAPGIHWASGEPSQAGNCAVVSKDGKIFLWKAVSCTSIQDTICVINTTDPSLDRTQSPPGRVSPARTSSSPGFVMTTARSVYPPGQHNRDPSPNVGVAVGLTIFFIIIIVVAAVAMYIYLRRKKSRSFTPRATDKVVERKNEPSTMDMLLPNANSSEHDSNSVSPGNKLTKEDQQRMEQYVKGGAYHTAGSVETKPQSLDLKGDEWEASKSFDSNGGELRVQGSNIVLTVSKEAVAQAEKVSMTMRVDTDIAKYQSDVKSGEMVVIPIVFITIENKLNEKAHLEIPYISFDQQVLNFYSKQGSRWQRLLGLKGTTTVIKFDHEKIYKHVSDTEILMVTCQVPENPIPRWQTWVYAEYFRRDGFQEFELRVYVFDVAHSQNDFFKAFERREKGCKVSGELSIDCDYNPSARDMVRCGIKLRSEEWACDEGDSVEEKTVADITSKHQLANPALFNFVVKADGEAEDSIRVDIEFEIRPKLYDKMEQEIPESAMQPTRHTMRIFAEEVQHHQGLMDV